MWTSAISPSVHYIGVNDRSTHLFEGLWPLPHGVSYNSYMIIGSEKVAIIDGVDASFAPEHIDAIKAILGDRTPDYLIINHMEPDHSGGIELLKRSYPELKIVGNGITLQQIKGFYGIEDGTMSIKDGDTIELGPETTLRLVTTPLVHWPETMMTYFEEEGILFSGDAFGCFGALDGAALDSNLDTSLYFNEMVRYYTNIVAKYGAFVQKALKKLDSFNITTICPTHGPVWQQELGRVIDLYDHLSRYEPLDNGATVVYGSMYGNTLRMAEQAARTLVENGIRPVRVINAGTTDLSFILAEVYRHTGLIIASPTYSESLFPPVRNLVEALTLRGIPNHKVAWLTTHTWAGRAGAVLSELFSKAGVTPLTEGIEWKHAPGDDTRQKTIAMARAMADELQKE